MSTLHLITTILSYLVVSAIFGTIILFMIHLIRYNKMHHMHTDQIMNHINFPVPL